MAKKGETASEETKARMREAHLRRWKAKRFEYIQACISPHVGAKRSKATRLKMRKAHLGRSHSPKTIEKIRRAALARTDG